MTRKKWNRKNRKEEGQKKMKPFAKSFYNSKKWKDARKAYVDNRIRIDGGICEKCKNKPGVELHHIEHLTPGNINDPDITINPDNLMLLCKDCHFAEHRAECFHNYVPEKYLYNGIWWDKMGIPRKQWVTMINGAPGSGRHAAIEDYKMDGDIIIDAARIADALIVQGKNENLTELVDNIISTIKPQVKNGKIDARQIYIITSIPGQAEAEAEAESWGANLMQMKADIDTCRDNIIATTTGRYRQIKLYQMEKYFENVPID